MYVLWHDIFHFSGKVKKQNFKIREFRLKRKERGWFILSAGGRDGFWNASSRNLAGIV